jgi:hypothetical protein
VAKKDNWRQRDCEAIDEWLFVVICGYSRSSEVQLLEDSFDALYYLSRFWAHYGGTHSYALLSVPL